MKTNAGGKLMVRFRWNSNKTKTYNKKKKEREYWEPEQEEAQTSEDREEERCLNTGRVLLDGPHTKNKEGVQGTEKSNLEEKNKLNKNNQEQTELK